MKHVMWIESKGEGGDCETWVFEREGLMFIGASRPICELVELYGSPYEASHLSVLVPYTSHRRGEHVLHLSSFAHRTVHTSS